MEMRANKLCGLQKKFSYSYQLAYQKSEKCDITDLTKTNIFGQ